jgi:nitrite reductase (NADH) small subunit
MTERLIDVAATAEIPPGTREIVAVDGLQIGVFNVAGDFHAILNRCPHQAGPLCEGSVIGTVIASEDTSWQPVPYLAGGVLRCPWHRFEFDIATGVAVKNPRFRVRTYPTVVVDGRVKVVMRSSRS